MKMKSVKELLEVHGKAEKESYFDWENGSFVDAEVFNAMKPFFLEKGYGNPAITHRIGWETYESYGIEKEKIANSLNVDSVNLALTFSSTESNNISVLGTTKLNKKRKKIIVSSVEHLSVLHAARALYDQGIKIETIPVSHNGVVNLDILQEKLDENTLMVSLQSINHEIGTIQPIKEAIEIVKDKDEDIYFHTDASAAYGRIHLDFLDLNVDFGTISSQKILGPKSIAGLYVKDGIRLKSIYEGQLSVETLSPDVEYMPLLAGFAKAVEIQFNKFKEINEYTLKLRDKLMYGLQTTIPRVEINGPEGHHRAPDNINLSFLGCEGEALTLESSMNGIFASSGSACTSRILMPSHILTAIGRKPEEAHGSFLMKLTRLNTEEEVNYTLETLPKVIKRIRSITGGIEL